jgi:hypothetical protein
MVAHAWLLNFDVEDELASGSAHTTPRAVEGRFRALADKAVGLVVPGDVVLWPGVRAEGLVGRAWCPTPLALARIAGAGARVPCAPSLDVLRRVNHRRFSADLGQTLPGARYVIARQELDQTLRARPGLWILKRPFGFAGRGRLKIDAAPLSALSGREQRWIEASFATGEGLQVEPWVRRERDFALHGYVGRAGAVLGVPTEQRCDAAGAWVSSERAGRGALSGSEHDALVHAARASADALAAAGYFGPFGVDAYRFVGDSGAAELNPRSEINARYSMGWAVGMGEVRPDLEDE